MNCIIYLELQVHNQLNSGQRWTVIVPRWSFPTTERTDHVASPGQCICMHVALADMQS